MSRRTQSNSKQNNVVTYIILMLGIGFRLAYILLSSIYDRQHDEGMIDLTAGHTVSGGHLAYIQYLYENMHLPDVDPTTVYQFHHPPFHHFVTAIFMKIVSGFTSNTHVIEESIQFVPFICSVIILIATCLILNEFNMSGRSRNFALVIIAFHPALILLSGSVNNDCMALMFSVLSILFTLRWIEDKSYKNIVCIALCLGLGISTKQNVAELAFPIGLVFICVLFDAIRKEKNAARIIKQYLLAGVISLPIGLWFYIRNLVKYNMSIMWVYELPEDSWQYTGNVPVINRLMWPIPADMINNLKHFKVGCGYNVWMQIIRTSVLGEWDMAGVGISTKIVALLLMFTGAVIAFAALICFIRVFLTKFGGNRINPLYRLLFVVGYVVTMASYLMFAYKYPQECSMHFRYIEITLFFTVVAVGMVYDRMKKQRLKYLSEFVVGVFGLLSITMCMVWIFV